MIVLTFSQDEFQTMLTNAITTALAAPSARAEGASPETHIKGIKGLSEFLKVSHSRAQALKNSGIFPHFQAGRLILFEPKKVREAMEAYTKRPRRAK
jgi:hypothetical protein